MQQVWELYHGDTTVAIVKNGVCVRSFVRSQTGAVYQRSNPENDPNKGLDTETLKAYGFSYKWTEEEVEPENPGF
jgi:hypothetical protein